MRAAARCLAEEQPDAVAPHLPVGRLEAALDARHLPGPETFWAVLGG